MDAVRDLVADAGCAADGATAARNPLAKFMDTLMTTPHKRGAGMGGMRVGAGAVRPGYAAVRGLHQHGARAPHPVDLEHAFAGAGHEAAAMDAAWQQSVHGPMRFAPHEDVRFLHHVRHGHGAPGHPAYRAPAFYAPSDAAAMDAAVFDESHRWVEEFTEGMQHHSHPSSDAEAAHGFAASQPLLPGGDLERAWGTAAGPEADLQAAQGEGSAVEDTALAASRDLAARLSTDADPRMRQSQLAQFMHKLGHGELRIDGAQVRATASSEASTAAPAEAMDAAWQDASAAAVQHADMADPLAGVSPAALEAAWADADVEPSGEAFGQLWNELMTSADSEAALDAIWRGVASSELLAEREAGAGEQDGLLADELLPYALVVDNPYLARESPLQEGTQLLGAGRVGEAILALQAAVQRTPEQQAEAWRLLGQCHAEHDQDREAIACLQRAVDHDPYNLDALLALGVSYVNEMDYGRALRVLKAWVQHNPAFAGLQIRVDEYSDGTLLDEVMQLMLQAAAWEGGAPQVQEVLGVLYNVSRDYVSAAAAFRASLEATPQSYALWNKLGATLANSGRCEEALPAYQRCVRARAAPAPLLPV